jgi:hypothetical protein
MIYDLLIVLVHPKGYLASQNPCRPSADALVSCYAASKAVLYFWILPLGVLCLIVLNRQFDVLVPGGLLSTAREPL